MPTSLPSSARRCRSVMDCISSSSASSSSGGGSSSSSPVSSSVGTMLMPLDCISHIQLSIFLAAFGYELHARRLVSGVDRPQIAQVVIPPLRQHAQLFKAASLFQHWWNRHHGYIRRLAQFLRRQLRREEGRQVFCQ